MKHSVQTRAEAARLIREGKSYAQVATETGTSKATIKRWAKDPAFLNLIDGAGVLTLGHIEVRTAESDLLEQAPSTEGWVWIGEGTVVGSLLVEGAPHLRAVFLTSPERVQTVREELAQNQLPVLAGSDRTVVLVPEALPRLQDDPEALELLTRICTGTPAESFPRLPLDLVLPRPGDEGCAAAR